MNKILNYIKINELISTSGQPKIEELDEELVKILEDKLPEK